MATDLEKLVVQLSADIKGYEREMRKAVGVSHKQAREIENRFRAMQGRLDRTGKSAAQSLIAPFGGVAAALGGRELIRMTGVWTDLTSRVNLAAGSMEKGSAVMQRVSEMARRTYSGLEQTAEGYLSFSTVLGELGVSTDRQLDFVESLNNALVVSGAKGQVAERVMSALSKAMATGTLQGENLNAVIEVGGRVAQALADSMGVSTMELRKLGSEGKIGRREMLGITTQMERLRREAGEMPGTIQDGFTLLNNALLKYVGEGDQAVGISGQIADALTMIADNFDTVADAGLQVAAIIAGALVGRSLLSMIRTAGVGVASIVAMTKALAAMRVAGIGASVALGPLGLVLGGVLAGGAILYADAARRAEARTSGLKAELEKLGIYAPRAAVAVDEVTTAIDNLSDNRRIAKVRELRAELSRVRGQGWGAMLPWGEDNLKKIREEAYLGQRGVGAFQPEDRDALRLAEQLAVALMQGQVEGDALIQRFEEIASLDISEPAAALVERLKGLSDYDGALEKALVASGGSEELEKAEAELAKMLRNLELMRNSGQWDAEIVDGISRVLEGFQSSETSAEDAKRAIADIANANPDLSAIIGRISTVIGWLSSLRAEAADAKAELRGLGRDDYISSGRGNAVGEYWAERRKTDAFIAEQARLNGLSKERQDIERRTAAILKDAGQAGAALTQAQAEQLAIEQAAAEARRTKEGRGGGRGKKGKSEYADEVIQIREAIAALEAEATALNGAQLSLSGYGDVAVYAQKRMELLVAAQKQGLTVTPQLSAEIDKLAQDYVNAANAVDAAKERHEEFESALSETRSTMEGAFTGLITGAHSFRDALSQVLSKLAEMAANRAFASLWDGAGGSGSGGGIGKGIGGFLGGLLGFDGGGPTPGGHRKKAVGIVHAGENVWSQDDIRRAGGMAVVEAMRRNGGQIPGYSSGGVVGAPPRTPALPSVSAAPNVAAQMPRITINNNAPGVVVSKESVSRDEVRIMVRQGIADNNRSLGDRRYLSGAV